ncbi:exonuclease domain-containing protein [Paraglaciecola aquimarina]|uniref:Exonuclease domain-containing protein n=1 Tax=Paraglaciecola algarum TaxID=3050085 RepID=A0ABS9D2W5_9ALTE|nr:3'-5' exonuclease [Paraglaciecola sp. G1-23]MCF2947255.1 exonuclease domain-containing protein [Paraglaciecola sp. G1-23]
MPQTLVIFDTEFTAWQGSKERNWSEVWEHREIIQIAAIKVQIDLTELKIISSFNCLVKPKINSKLSDYIIDLTGIEQHVLDEMGVDFPAVLQQFYQFTEQGSLACFAWGKDNHVLTDNCLLNGIDMPDFCKGFHNLHAMIRKQNIDGGHLCSGELANHLGLSLNGHVHNALYDVRSIALALNYWMQQGLVSENTFKPINKAYQQKH